MISRTKDLSLGDDLHFFFDCTDADVESQLRYKAVGATIIDRQGTLDRMEAWNVRLIFHDISQMD